MSTNEKKHLSLSDLAQIKEVVEVDIPELKGCAFVRNFTAGTRLKIEENFIQVQPDGKAAPNAEKFFQYRFAVLQASLCDADGELLASDEEDLEEVKKLPAEILDRIVEAAQELNGLSGGEETEKNLPSPGDASPSS
jgi:hypothetical protein